MNRRVSDIGVLLIAFVLSLWVTSNATSDRFTIGVIDGMGDPIDLNVVDDRLSLWMESFYCDNAYIIIELPRFSGHTEKIGFTSVWRMCRDVAEEA